MADEQQEQQCETVTTTTTERNLYKLLSVGELIFEIDLRSDGPPANQSLELQNLTTPNNFHI